MPLLERISTATTVPPIAIPEAAMMCQGESCISNSSVQCTAAAMTIPMVIPRLRFAVAYVTCTQSTAATVITRASGARNGLVAAYAGPNVEVITQVGIAQSTPATRSPHTAV